MEIKLTRWFVYEWEKPTKQKPHHVILRSPLLWIFYYQNKRLQVKKSQFLIPTYSWTLTPIHNWTCSLVTISYFQCTTLSTWLTNICMYRSTRLNHQLEKDVDCKVLQFIHDEDPEDAWSQNPTLHKHNNFYIRTMNKLCSILVQLVSTLTVLKIILLYV